MHSKKILGVMFAFIIVLAMFSVLQPKIETEATLKIDPNLVEQMEEGDGLFKAIVKVAWNPNIEPIKYQHDAVVNELQAEAARTQEPVLTYLRQKRDAEILNTFWLDNLVLVEANEDTIRELATLTTVERVFADFTVTTLSGQMKEISSTSTAATTPATWNIQKVRAPEVWDTLHVTGEGIKFATTDTGVDIAHQDLAGSLYTSDPTDPKYPGGWAEFDANGKHIWSVPRDSWIHGTATYGVIVGDSKSEYGAVGMAPGAKGLGMCALSLPGGQGAWPQVVAGLEWVLQPHDEAGKNYTFPLVSSHSWGAIGYFREMIAPIRNMWYAGHFVVASIGNSWEGTSGSPGNVYETFSAGATDINDDVADVPEEDWGSSGEVVYKTDFPPPVPEDWPDSWIVPDVCAPGRDVVVPIPGNTYRLWGGTSFASPHVAGAAMLMLSSNPYLTPPELAAVLQGTAVWYDRYYPSKPDTRYGWGRIDAYKAVEQVALPQGIFGTVTDAVTGQPISNAKVYVVEEDTTTYTDANGRYWTRFRPSTYTVEVSKFGYYSVTMSNVVVEKDKFTLLNIAMTPIVPGYISGYVYHGPTMIGIPGAMVEALDVPVQIQTLTDVDGAYTLALPPGTYDFQASSFGFGSETANDVVVNEGETTIVDFYLTQPPKVAVVDYYTDYVLKFLIEKKYAVDQYKTIADVIPKVPEYSTIVVSRPGSTPTATLRSFIAATDANGVGVVWLDSWASYTGGYLLYYYGYTPKWPPYRGTYYASSIQALYYKVTATDDDIIPGWSVGDKIIHDSKSYYKDHAWYTGILDNATVKVLAGVGRRYATYDSDILNSQGIVKVTRATNKWMLLSMHANTPYTDVSYWTDDTKAVFLNSINWAGKAHVGLPKFVVWDLKAEPKVGLWSEPRTVSVGVKNVGWITGTETYNMYVDTILEGTATVTLAPGEYTYPSWTVSRFEVGTYTAKVKHLTTTFTVRPPQITVQAYEYNSNKPLAGADIYGYYRKYEPPGWQEQWSKVYGGYGHSQHAQPIGDIDEDGINEIIVGGYETPGYGIARILSYDAGLGTYIEEYNWYVPGGSYHSPSGSTVLDLDEDGDNEFVMSWTYSGADGIYAYDWDGTTLTQLDYYPCGFVFDVYSCDYDDDGHLEVLIANQPDTTPYNVVAFRWENSAFVWEADWYSGVSWETSMIWSGDTDNDGKTEVIACVSDSYYSTLGTFALNWDPSTNSWTADLVYSGLIGGGTHYGVTVGDINGNGIDEIGIGNDYSDYTINAAACLVEWDGSKYQKVWEGSWPTESPVIEAISIGDADNDGDNEFYAGGSDVHVIGWTGTQYVEESTITQTSGLLSGVNIGDMDNDGLNELKACDIIGAGPGKEWVLQYAATPSPGATWVLKNFGTTDANGMLTFDSPASVVEMYLFVYKSDKTALGYQYLLSSFHYIDADMVKVYTPKTSTEALVISKPNARGLEGLQHLGVTWLQYDGIPVLWPFVSFKTNPTNIVVTPQTYVFRHMLNIVDPFGSWWYYFMAADRIAALAGGQKYIYGFAGNMQGYVDSVQTGSDVTIYWTANDGYGHQITGIDCEEVDWLASGTTEYMPVPIKPDILGDIETQVGETIDYYPLMVLYDAKKNIIESGYSQWYAKPCYTSTTKTVYYAQLNFVSGPYGNPNAKIYVTVITEPTP